MDWLETLRDISTRDFASLGLHDVAYVKPVEAEGKTAYSIYAADGTEMGMVHDREVAFAAVRQHDLEPVSVH
jgi:hypothetical protein